MYIYIYIYIQESTYTNPRRTQTHTNTYSDLDAVSSVACGPSFFLCGTSRGKLFGSGRTLYGVIPREDNADSHSDDEQSEDEYSDIISGVLGLRNKDEKGLLKSKVDRNMFELAPVGTRSAMCMAHVLLAAAGTSHCVAVAMRELMHPCVHTYIHTYIRTYVHTYVHAYIHTYIHKCLHTCIYT
jgi:hypothetical protein